MWFSGIPRFLTFSVPSKVLFFSGSGGGIVLDFTNCSWNPSGILGFSRKPLELHAFGHTAFRSNPINYYNSGKATHKKTPLDDQASKHTNDFLGVPDVVFWLALAGNFQNGSSKNRIMKEVINPNMLIFSLIIETEGEKHMNLYYCCFVPLHQLFLLF